MIEKILVDENEKDERLDKFCSKKVPDWISRNFIQNSIKNGSIKVNKKIKKPNYKIKTGDLIYIEVPEKPEKPEILPENINLNIIYEDDDIIVINKPYNMIVHPAGKIYNGTLVNALKGHIDDFEDIGDELRTGIVHRLDKDTSGLIIVAKNNMARENLSKQFQERTIRKFYIALTKGPIQRPQGIINRPISRHPTQRHKMAIIEGGKESITKYKIIKKFNNNLNLVWINLKTGRTHQIRVHFKYLKSPLLGDSTYSKIGKFENELCINRQMLHAVKMNLFHPRTNEWMEFIAPIPDDFKNAIKNIYNKYGD
ncbi:RluA family pseudouridine synthase [Oceanotoga sp. DSM 15011]|jgi:23S rRNA pseudouridine1911/1915/1917 synthase|uniref:Pseudouridine synthase n=1 Tax=Oceanotoga teriensis TaxID=515440 RepID=A0AA45C648_9BACT|nr:MULTISPECIES: RluA family pseudouridine synthase [Oceanotoga]MDN5341761.1 rRNA synthase [Oceanotoga sp.]MDO7975673.1 RluA family pseudouridine synthase [Oceanotoga teriensis]PWJ90578.1 ribosomal large subunit pseudouridine synthase D [Oceanotoga teriensis]UYO99823.1 RluA family pseudouridine synthase [Oceanotoga sp. DSM 15011]